MRIMLKEGETLWEALCRKGTVLDRPCGGRGTCGKCRVSVLGLGTVNSCQFCEPGGYEVLPEGQESFDTVTLETPSLNEDGKEDPAACEEWWERPVILADIGTTTVAMAAFWRDQTIHRSFINPQRAFGADVLSRIGACAEGKQELLRKLLWKQFESEVEDIAGAWAQTKEDGADGRSAECKVYIAGNTTMLHILQGYPCEGLGKAPFTSVDLSFHQESIKTSGGYSLNISYMPGISAFVGGDIVSGMYAAGMAEKDEITLLLDLGTNGEMVLGNRQRLLCASAAAGPALEGSELAVCIHASGILRLLHQMRECGAMDTYGTLKPPWFQMGYPAEGTLGQVMTQEDIRQIQMAKASIAAGIDILIKEYGITPKEIRRVYLAGGMGYYLDPGDAEAVGILAAGLAEKTIAAGNSCLRGLYRFAKADQRNRKENPAQQLEKLCEQTEEIILAKHPDFEELYIEKMNF